MKTYAYIRTSTKHQSPILQVADIKLLYPKDDLVILEEKQSAWKDNVLRPVFQELMGLIKKSKVENLYVWDLDRIYRNRLKLKEFFELCKINQVKIHSVNQKWFDEFHKIPPPFNDMMYDMLINLFGWIGEEESGKKSERIKLAVVKKDNTKTVSYKGNRWGRKPFPKQTISRVLELADSGLSIRQIANQVTVFDKNRNEKKISRSSVHKILTSKTCEKARLIDSPIIN
jgi:DNA invertase Pin-like site-specific DNA recombinase